MLFGGVEAFLETTLCHNVSPGFERGAGENKLFFKQNRSVDMETKCTNSDFFLLSFFGMNFLNTF